MTAKSIQPLFLRILGTAMITLLALGSSAAKPGGGPQKCFRKDLLSKIIPVKITFEDFAGAGILGDGGSYADDVQAQLNCNGNINMASIVDFVDTGRFLTFDFTKEFLPTDGTRCGTTGNEECKATFTPPPPPEPPVGTYILFDVPFGWFNAKVVDGSGNLVAGGAICMTPGTTSLAKFKVILDGGFSVAFNPFQDTPGYRHTNVISVTRRVDDPVTPENENNSWILEAPTPPNGELPNVTDADVEVGPIGNLRAKAVKKAGPTNEGNYHLAFRATVTCAEGADCGRPTNCPQ